MRGCTRGGGFDGAGREDLLHLEEASAEGQDECMYDMTRRIEDYWYRCMADLGMQLSNVFRVAAKDSVAAP